MIYMKMFIQLNEALQAEFKKIHKVNVFKH